MNKWHIVCGVIMILERLCLASVDVPMIVQTQENNIADAIVELRSKAEQGDAQAQYNLGVLYANGMGVDKDFTKAVELYKKAAEQGYISAQFNLGLCYAFGDGVENRRAGVADDFRGLHVGYYVRGAE